MKIEDIAIAVGLVGLISIAEIFLGAALWRFV